MNYRFYIKLNTQNGKSVTLGQNHVIAWDVRDLISASSGWLIVNDGCIGRALEMIPVLQKGISQLRYSAADYASYEAMHGLGTIETVLAFYQSLLQDCMHYPNFLLCGEISK